LALPAGLTVSRARRAHVSAWLPLPVPILGAAQRAGKERVGQGADSLGDWVYVAERLGPMPGS
jgi:hypothetical protein